MIEGQQLTIFDFMHSIEKPIMEEAPKVICSKRAEHDLTLDNLRPCECGYSGRMAVTYTGCGIPINGYLKGTPIFEKYMFTVFCPKCFNTASAGGDWHSSRTDKKKAMRDWNENKHIPYKNVEYLKRYADKMDETVTIFDGFTDEVNE